MRLLIIDDEPAALFAMSAYFDQSGWSVDCAGELEEAQALLANIRYDVVIVDIRLSGLQQAEGLHVLSFIRDRGIEVPAIVLTAYATDEVRQEIHRLGVSHILGKPQPLESIAALINSLTSVSADRCN